jgi:superfamily II DNA or RNA helicase
MRGRAYQLGGRVQRVEPAEDELVRAEVRGRESYTVTIRREDRAASAECTCPAFDKGAYCKHIWATLLDLQHNAEGPGASVMDIAKLRVRAPKARKRDLNRPKATSGEPTWVGRLSLMRVPGFDSQSADRVFPDQRQVCYAVLPRLSTRQGGLVVDLRQRTPSGGGWGKPKAMRISPAGIASLTDPVDRELCALLLGSNTVHEHEMDEPYRGGRGHATFRLQAGAWRALLQRMIQTGRCFIEADDNEPGANTKQTPLTWDGGKPWVLWMTGKIADEELAVGVELRRGDERMAIDKPTLVLGGWDGLLIYEGKAAPLDDRDAFRWASQFREDTKRGHDAPSPLRVPVKDVPNFLDRLYLLPQLPEIDLPEGIAREEQLVKPVACLDLNKPGEGGQNKNQITARVWFDYAGQRVNPSLPGRYVPVTPVAAAHEHAALPAHPDVLTETHADSAQASAETTGAEAATGVSVEAEPASRPIRRDHPAERRALGLLMTLGLRQANGDADELVVPTKQMVEVVQTLLMHGWVVNADRRVVRQASAPRLSVSSGIDWFELHGSVAYQRADGTEQRVALPQILAMAKSGQDMITLDDGTQGLLPQQWLAEHGLLTGLGKLHEDHLRYKSSQVALLDALLREQEQVEIDDPFRQARERLNQFDGVKPLDAKDGFHGSLRPYQQQGLGWLSFLRWFGVGGVLADDMGLGKTIQVLAMLHNRKLAAQAAGENNAEPDAEHHDAVPHRPTLVIAPRSVVFNWLDEAEHFAPNLKVLAYSGTEREAMRADFDDHDLIVTSYGLMRRDIADLKEHKFDYIVLDEAQAIKNPASQSAKAARLLDARHRVALTGTPIENHLGDLWSIFEFLNPGMLGSNKRFNDMIRAGTAASRNTTQANGVQPGEPAEDAQDADAPDSTEKTAVLSQISQAIRPFVMRRAKSQVLKDLPKKTEQTIVCQMEPEQRKVYDELRTYYHNQLLTQLDEPGDKDTRQSGIGGKPAFMVLEALLRLRQAACHPGLIDPQRANEPSAKLDSLLDRLADVIDEGSKALVFSQFTSMLSLVKPRLEERGIKFSYLDGQTRNRREVVKEFQEDSSIPLFLISLKAGGFGLNLTAAEYVFILDPWWNPAVEAQAIDRTHRIGQTKPVFAYRMVCQDTVEQRIVDLQNRKRKLAEAIVGGDDSLLRSLSREDLEKLLS